MDLSVLIAARQEVYLQKTIESVLAASEAETEVIAVCDGYWPAPAIQDHSRVTLIHHTEARGQRQSINEAAKIAKGTFLMKLDAHCSVGQGFDRVLIEDYQEGQTVVPRQYNLDVETWQPRFLDDTRTAIRQGKLNDYMYIGWNDKGEFRTLYYNGKERKELHSRPQRLDATMSCMGPGWFCSAEQFWKQGGCDEMHGGWGQQGIEVALKAWLIGEGLWVNKRTWFSHWFRGGGGPGFPYPLSGREVGTARKYSQDLWLNNKCPGQIRTFKWLLQKFWPVPGWTEADLEDQAKSGVDEVPRPGLSEEKLTEIHRIFWRHIHKGGNDPTWRGIEILKSPMDLQLYQEKIFLNKPKWIIETGTAFGGSAVFFQDMLDIVGEGGRVITIDRFPDLFPRTTPDDPRVLYLTESSTDREVVERVRAMVGADSVMVVLDSDHSRIHVKWELYHWAPLVTQGQYIVVEDCYNSDGKAVGPNAAIEWYLKRGRGVVHDDVTFKYLVGITRGGWLRKV